MLRTNALRLITSSAPDVMSLQTNVKNLIEPVAQVALLNGNAIQGVALAGTSGVVRIVHNLGRAPQGYFITRKNGTLDVWDLPTNNADLTNALFLNWAGTASSFDVWIF